MITVKNKWVTAGDRLFVPGDIHAPNHNKRALALAMYAAQKAGCNKAAVLGDGLDSCHISRHGHSRDSSFDAENSFVADFSSACKVLGMAPTFWITGNHEGWFEEWSATNPGLSHAMAYPALHANWDVLPQGACVPLNKRLMATHGDALNGSTSTNPAAAVLRHYPANSVIFGHNHRWSMDFQTRYTPTATKTYMAVSVGTLANLDFERSKKALRLNSQRHNLGFAVVSLFENDLFDVQLGRIMGNDVDGYICLLSGEIYKESDYDDARRKSKTIRK